MVGEIDAVHAVDRVHVVHAVHSIHAVHAVHVVHAVRAVHEVHAVNAFHVVYAVHAGCLGLTSRPSLVQDLQDKSIENVCAAFQLDSTTVKNRSCGTHTLLGSVDC